jgi:hypothetical protein
VPSKSLRPRTSLFGCPDFVELEFGVIDDFTAKVGGTVFGGDPILTNVI